jgi:lipopolysaccharide transport system permease protein
MKPSEPATAHLDLLVAWTSRIIRARYQQSVLGILWAIIQPAATVVIFSFVFTRIVSIETNGIPYVLFSFATLVPWTLFATSLTDMVSCVVDNMNLVAKVYFPRELLALGALLARLVDFVIALLVLITLMLYFRIPLFTFAWIYLPLVLIIQLSLSLGLGLAGAALNVFYRDIKHLVALGLQLWIYASPVIYPVSSVPTNVRSFYFLNPMAGVIEAYRGILLHGTPPNVHLMWAGCIALVSLLAGYWYFKSLELDFADIG